MKRLEFQITQVRNSTDNKDTNGISDAEIVGYFNDAQKYITTLVFKNNPYADLFKVQKEYPAGTTGIYDLPEDCYSSNAISMVEGRYAVTENNNGYSRIKPVAESEFSYMFGYIVRNNQVIISGQNNISQLTSVRITYFKQLPTLDIRQATINAVTPGVSIGLVAEPISLYSMDDHCSVVDNQGDQLVSDIYFSNATGTSLITTDTSGVVTGNYIVSGSNACNRSQLPDVCEPYLFDYVKQRIYTRNNYSDADKQLYFTEQQKAEVISIFSKNKKDDDIIPITDVGFLLF